MEEAGFVSAGIHAELAAKDSGWARLILAGSEPSGFHRPCSNHSPRIFTVNQSPRPRDDEDYPRKEVVP